MSSSAADSLFSAQDVLNYFNALSPSPGFTLSSASGLENGSASLPLTQVTENDCVRLSVPIQVGNVTIPFAGQAGPNGVTSNGVIVDTGSAGVTISCDVLLGPGALTQVPASFPQQGVYVTDIPVVRDYDAGATQQNGYLAIAQITLGSGSTAVTAPMPFVLVTKYSNSSPDSSALIGINPALNQSANGSGPTFVSALRYFDYSPASLTMGFIVSSSTLTVGLASNALASYVTVQLQPIVNAPPELASTAWFPALPATLQVPGTDNQIGNYFVFDTGTPPGSGKSQICVPQLPGPTATGTLAVLIGSQTVVQIDSTFDIVTAQNSLIGLDFLLNSSVTQSFGVDFIAGQAGFALTGSASTRQR